MKNLSSIIMLTTLINSNLFAKVIKTEDLFEKPESVIIYDKYIYVTNQGKLNWQKPDSDGFISKVDLKGNISNLTFTSGLNDPKGIAMYKDNFVVTDITQLVFINKLSGKIINRIKTNATFLNDIFINSDGIAFVTDTYKSKIYSVNLQTQKVEIFKENMQEAPNGIYQLGDYLYIASWANTLVDDWTSKMKGRVLKINVKTKKEIFISKSNLGNLDGIEPVSPNFWLVSDKLGNTVYKLNERNGTYKPLDLEFKDVADIHFSNGILVAPLTSEGRLIITDEI
jgi:DNA-binding beta-propeller fold protein YncE